MKETVRLSFKLGVICFAASAILALVNSFAQPKIQEQKNREEKEALGQVVPDAAEFKESAQNGKLNYYSAFDNSGKLIGFVIKCQAKGYSSIIETLVGLDLNLDIQNIKVISQNETPGLGNKVKGELFLRQFKGKNLSTFGEISAITGATISSSAVINSVKIKISELQGTLRSEIKNAR